MKNRKVKKLVSVGNLILPVTDDGFCIFLQDSLSCGIYSERPGICRTFGSEIHLLMKCPYQSKKGRPRGTFERLLLSLKLKFHVTFQLCLKKENKSGV